MDRFIGKHSDGVYRVGSEHHFLRRPHAFRMRQLCVQFNQILTYAAEKGRRREPELECLIPFGHFIHHRVAERNRNQRQGLLN